jgi:hypothetical protein
MKRRVFGATAVLFSALMLQVAVGQESVKSGPQVGQDVPGPFHPLNVTGSAKGKKNCLFCSNGANPVAVVFARELTPEVAKLIKKLDNATVENQGKSMGSYAVFCNDAEGLQTKLEEMAAKQGLKSLVLSIDNPSGPKDYRISKDAAVTVLLYDNFTVRANHAFASNGQLNDAAINRVVADVSKIVPAN